MGLTAAVAAAVAAWCAAAVLAGADAGAFDLPPLLYGLGLLPGVAAAASRRAGPVLRPGRDMIVIAGVTGGGLLVAFVTGLADVESLDVVARLLLLAVLPLALLWPEPNILRYCLLLVGGSLLGSAGSLVESRALAAGVLGGLAVALVATNRMSAAALPRLAPSTSATRRRRLVAEAAVVAVVVGLVAGIAASLIPPPPADGSGAGDGGSRRGDQARPSDPEPLGDADRLEVGGGRGPHDDRVVLRVTAPGADLWRARTFDHWDGRAWTASAGDRPDTGGYEFGRSGGRRTFVPPGVGDDDYGGFGGVTDDDVLGFDRDGVTVRPFVQRIRVEAGFAAVLPAAARPSTVEAAGTTVVVAADGSLTADPPLGRRSVYVVESSRTFPGPDALRAADPRAGPVPDDVAFLYLPDAGAGAGVSPRARALAAEVTAGAPTGYDAVLAVEAWLAANTVRRDRSAPLPPGADVVDDLLFGERAGTPERVNTALVLLLRSVGFPARMAVGFLPGSRSLGGEFTVRASDAHAWAEAWFPGAGWHRFDGTGLAPPARPDGESLLDRLARLLTLLWVPLVVAAVVLVGRRLWRLLATWRRWRARPWVGRVFLRLERAGSARGRPRRPEETVAEYSAALAASVLPDPRIEELGRVLTAAAWSARDPSPEEQAWAEDVLRDVTQAHGRRRPALTGSGHP